MKVQWQLVDMETGKAVKVGDEFELIDYMKKDFDEELSMDWIEACLFYGNPLSPQPKGILNL